MERACAQQVISLADRVALRRVQRLCVAISSAALLTACVITAQDRQHAMPAIGQPYSDYVAFGGNQVPLPSGEWVVAGKSVEYNNARTRLVGLVLARIEGNTLRGLVDITTADEVQNFNGYVVYRDCLRVDVHHTFVRANLLGGEQDCWLLNHKTMTTAGNVAPRFREAVNFAASKGVIIPHVMLSVDYRFADTRDYLNAHYYFSPEELGATVGAQTDWRNSDWHRDKVHMDSKRADAISRLRAWGDDWRQKVKLGYENKLGTSEQPTPAQLVPVKVGDERGNIEKRLQTLEDLRSRGVISPAEYEVQRREILKSL